MQNPRSNHIYIYILKSFSDESYVGKMKGWISYWQGDFLIRLLRTWEEEEGRGDGGVRLDTLENMVEYKTKYSIGKI